MNKRVLEKILESDSDYFVIESYDYNGKDRQLVLIALPENLRRIRHERDISTITLLEYEMFKEAYIETNIFLFPKFPPFQISMKPLYYARECVTLPKVDLAELLSLAGKSIYEIQDHYSAVTT